MSSRLSQPLLVHAHIPKTAGNSIRHLLVENFKERYSYLYLPHPQIYYKIAEIESYLAQNPEIQFLSSHFIRDFPEFLAGRRALYITFLRSPLELTMSLFRFLRKNYKALSAEQKTTLPPELDRMSLREIARFHIDHWFDENHQFSMQTAFFNPIRNLSLNQRPSGSGFYGKDDFTNALGHLNKFFFVGIVERMTESTAVLQKRLASVGIGFENTKVPTVNSTERDPGEEIWLNQEDEVGRAILACNRSDERLYRTFSARFEEAWQKCQTSCS